jgi:hypothetical protein
MTRIRNETIRTKMGMKKGIFKELEDKKLRVRWNGSFMRMQDNRVVRQVAEWNPQGKGRRGRPVSVKGWH